MDNQQWHHHLHHRNQSHPIHGNIPTICPTCSISHFPFCPPRAPHAPPPPRDPYIDPPPNPSMTHTANFGNFGSTNPERRDPGLGDEYTYLNDRSSKRLRVDGVRDRGGEVIYDLNQYNDMGSYGKLDNFGFDGNVNARAKDLVSSVGYNSNYRDEVGYRSSYGSYGGVKRSVFDGQDGIGHVGHEFGNRYGEMAKPVDSMGLRQGGVDGYEKDGLHQGYRHMDYRSSYGMNESSYGNSFEESRNLNNVALPSHYSSSQAPFVNTMQQHGHMKYDYHSASPSQFNERRYSLDCRACPVEGYQGSSRNLENAPVQYEQRNSVAMSSHYSSSHAPSVNTMQHGQMGYDCHSASPSQFNEKRYLLDAGARPVEGYQGSFGNQHVPMQSNYGPPHGDNHGGYGNMGHFRASQVDVRPPLPPHPASPPPPPPPPPPLPMEPPPPVSSLFPVVASSSSATQSSYAPVQPLLPSTQVLDSSRSIMQRDSQPPLSSSGHYVREDSGFPSKNSFKDKPKVLDASQLFKLPHRSTRPDHFVIILRGLPGSGKSYLAKMLRDLEVEHGGNAPRVHSMDDYFMTEVEKAEENETSKSSGRGKKPIMKKVLEYCYEPEMEEAYRASMLKAFKKTLDEGTFTFVIVDDRNLRVADFAQFWATAKRSGYEVYVLEAPYKDPAGCTARNVHGFTQDDVEKMAAQWEEAPSLYLQLGAKSLFHGDDLAESNIQEVDMDMDDGDFEGSLHGMEEREPGKNFLPSGGDVGSHGERSWDADDDNQAEVKDLGHSKWSSNLDDEDDERTEVLKGKPNVLSGLLKTYGKEGKSVHWGDRGGHTGFSIGAIKKANAVSLCIGPGAGYNMKSNPIPEDDVGTWAKSGETRKHSVFKERRQAEQESFKAVFDRRRLRIGRVEED